MAKKSEPQYGSVAERVMKKQGWKKGQGLGASNQGIQAPIKPSLKFDTAGVGHDPAAEFTSNSWEANYNRAASAIKVVIDSDSSDEEGEKVKFEEKKSTDTKEIKKNALYARFVNTATLDSGTMVSRVSEAAKDSDDDGKEGDSKGRERLDDDQLFEACGGMTAHKGARHGHSMKAKQDRIARMEAKLLREMTAEDGEKRGATQTKSKKRKKKTPEDESEAAAKKVKKSKKEKKKKKKIEVGS